jgi:hypothetical protein
VRYGFYLILLVLLISGCGSLRNASYKRSNPILVNFDVAPGYRDSVTKIIEEDADLKLSIRILKPNPHEKWNSNVYFALRPKETSQFYIFHILVDTTEKKVRAHIKLIGEDGSFLIDRRSPFLDKLAGNKELHVVLSKKKLIVSLNSVVTDEIVLPFQPSTFEVGASSGAFKIRFIEPPPVTNLK